MLKDKAIVIRRRYQIKGIVQGVGFRPFVYNLAMQWGVTGWIYNGNQGIIIEVQGPIEAIEIFGRCLVDERPKNSVILEIEVLDLPLVNETSFAIRDSEATCKPNTYILPDLAPCQDCLREMAASGNRRFRYPFINCTLCGPRYSILLRLPYDRKNTTMEKFKMCKQCRMEYKDPSDRRFHAQPIACPACGPQLSLLNHAGTILSKQEDALQLASNKVRLGHIVAIKGVGGFHLIVDAKNETGVKNLRERKKRSEKPFALMFPSLDQVRRDCIVSILEEELLTSQEAPIVLLKAKSSGWQAVSPNNPCLGIMLPSSPLHHLLMGELGFPIVATSGNRSDEPICTDETEALADLRGIADFFLVHNRPIAQRIDDSIIRIMLGRKLTLRRARGYSTLPIMLDCNFPEVLAVGGHQKNTVAAAKGKTVYISQHIGDLENQKAYEGFTNSIQKLLDLYEIEPKAAVADLHPEYISSKWAASSAYPLFYCQHHAAHVFACMAENQVKPPLLGVSWDGTGYGADGRIWGGEFFEITSEFSYLRIASFKPFSLPGGETAIKEPRFAAIGLLYEVFGDRIFEKKQYPPLKNLSSHEKNNLKRMLCSGFRTLPCSSVGRLFDAVSSLIGLREKNTFEGQVALELEFLSDTSEDSNAYQFGLERKNGILEIDIFPMVSDIVNDLNASKPKAEIGKKFHNTLVNIILKVSMISNLKKILLTGGVFQNKLLTENTIKQLIIHQFEPYWHKDIPPNDGGIALGQLYSLLGNADVFRDSGKS